MHEASLHKSNSFITLTYDENHLPYDFSLDYSHFQLFMKRLRKSSSTPIRFYMCGEYGESNHRPHYHACIFGYSFPDRRLWKPSNSGFPLFRSAFLESIWKLGFCTIGDLSFETAAYTARYIMKKQSGVSSYSATDINTGEIHSRIPEFTRMSLKPGIGHDWFFSFGQSDVVPRDGVVFNGSVSKPPRYYDKIRARDSPVEFELAKAQRIVNANSRLSNDGRSASAIRFANEGIMKAKALLLKRGFTS